VKKVYVNEKWCLGCRLCEYYCAFAAAGGNDMAKALKGVKPNSRIKIEKHGDISFAVSCRHCKEALCLRGCITGALGVTDGVVAIDHERCVSCYTCVLLCPYGAVSPSPEGPAQKCELCVKTTDGSPACVKGCPNRAIVFEDRGE